VASVSPGDPTVATPDRTAIRPGIRTGAVLPPDSGWTRSGQRHETLGSEAAHVLDVVAVETLAGPERQPAQYWAGCRNSGDVRTPVAPPVRPGPALAVV